MIMIIMKMKRRRRRRRSRRRRRKSKKGVHLVMAWLPCLTVTVGNVATSGNDFLRCIAEFPTACK